jgi:hypothetical protein
MLLVLGLATAWAQSKKGGAPNTLTPQEQKDGWMLLFDGKTLDNWDLRPGQEANWKAADGAILNDTRGGGTLLSKEDFADFTLKAEFRTTTDVNAGIMLRNPRPRPVAPGEKKKGGGQGYEVQIRDKDPGNYTGGSFLTASLVNVQKAPADAKIIPGQWNTFEITAQGDHFIIIYNGRKVVDAHNDRLKSGAIGLQWAHPEDAPGTKIEFRNLKVKRLGSAT